MRPPLKNTVFWRYLLPRRCIGCGDVLPAEEWERTFCEKCMIRYRAAKLESCPSCFLSAHECRCMPAGLSKTGMLCLRKLVLYRSQRRAEPQNQLIYRLKQFPSRRMAAFLVEELSVALGEELRTLGLDENSDEVRIVGIPRSRRAKNLYGHDQAPFLAQALGEHMGIPCVSALGRRFGGKEQKNLSSPNRFRNIRSLFFPTKAAEELRGRTVILLDDVVTTGASMAACVKVLRDCGAREFLGICIGQNENRGSAKRKT